MDTRKFPGADKKWPNCEVGIFKVFLSRDLPVSHSFLTSSSFGYFFDTGPFGGLKCVPGEAFGHSGSIGSISIHNCREANSEEDKLVADEFNKYFTSIGKNTIHKIQSLASECNYDLTQPSFVPRCYPLSEQFTFSTVECCEIQKVINSIQLEKLLGSTKSHYV